jgi:medium-chain acyl-[acyl-carrier-protein] hydrolase
MPWQEKLGPNIEICAIQLPGRGARFTEAAAENFDELVAAIADAIAPLCDVPFAFFGHSLGALIAFELAHRLSRQGLTMPRHVILSGCCGPRVRVRGRNLHLLPDDGLLEELRRYQGTPPEVLAHRELIELVLPMIRADFRLAAEYACLPRLPLSVPITVFAGRDDGCHTQDKYEDWFLDTTAVGRLEWFDGGHFFINSDNLRVIACIRKIIDVIGARASVSLPRVLL